MNVLHVGIFKDHCLGEDIVFKTGFLKNRVSHQEFDYRLTARQIGVDGMNQKLIDKAKGCDLVFIGKGEFIRPSTLAAVQKVGCSVAIWYGDLRPESEPWLIENLRHCDVFFMSSGGDVLKLYFERGKPGRAAFFLHPSNPNLVEEYSHIQRSVDPPLFTGTIHRFMGNERQSVYEYLCRRGDIQIVGSSSKCIRNSLLRRVYLKMRPVEYLRGSEYIERIIRSRFGIGVSAFQNVKYYTSDRLVHYLTFGKLYLAYRFPGCEDLFQEGVHLVYYDSIHDLKNKIEFYLANQERAEEIGHNGQKKILTEYNAKNMVKMMLEIINTGYSTMFPWVEVYS